MRHAGQLQSPVAIQDGASGANHLRPYQGRGHPVHRTGGIGRVRPQPPATVAKNPSGSNTKRREYMVYYDSKISTEQSEGY